MDFYTRVLGLRVVKKTVNFDDPGSYHLYFGDDLGRPGSAVTFFEWAYAAKGSTGIGGTHHFALVVEDFNSLLKWKRRLNDLGLHVDGPLDRVYFKSIYFRDPDGVILEIATRDPGWTVDEESDRLGADFRLPPPGLTIGIRDEANIGLQTWPEPVDEISADMCLSQGMHSIGYDPFYSERGEMTGYFGKYYRAIYCRDVPIDVYVNTRGQINRAVEEKAAELAKVTGPIIVWGCGDLAMHLLTKVNLDVVYYVDNDPAYKGATIDGVPVVDSVTSGEPIVVMAQNQATALLKRIQDLGLTNEVIVI